MAHTRPRHVVEKFNQLMRFSPIVGVFGHRQVGKSTFISLEIEDYRSLDDVDWLRQASSNPKVFVEHPRHKPLAIDECQLEPLLFPTLKERVRTDRRPGQYVLSGSVRFTSRKAIRESLAGRIGMIEMLPLTVSELAEVNLGNSVPRLLKQRLFTDDSFRALRGQKESTKLQHHLPLFMKNGGLPGLCFIRNEQLKRKASEDLRDLILARDLPLVSSLRTPLTTLRRLLNHIAQRPFDIYNASEVKRKLGLSIPTQQAILQAMEAVFLIRRIRVPLRRKWAFLMEDQYEELSLSDMVPEPQRVLESALYRNLRAQFEYALESPWETEIFLTRDNARVPLVFRNSEGCLGIMSIEGSRPNLSELRSAASFLRHEAMGKVIFASAERVEPRVLDDRSLLCSISMLL